MSRTQASLIVLLVFGSWAATLVLRGHDIDISFFSPFSWAVSALCSAYLVFNYYLWRFAPFTLLMPRPDVRGTWRGWLQSNWKDPTTGLPLPPREVFLVVYETSQLILVRLMTEESESVSLAALLVPEVDGRHQLLTMYRNDPKLSVRDRSPVHLGGAALMIGGDPPAQLSGHYWTDRGAAGELDFKLLTRQRVGSFGAAKLFRPQNIKPT